MFSCSKSTTENNISSIFRNTDVELMARAGENSSNQKSYEQQLHMRYYENDARLSWDVEENPPVESMNSKPLRNSSSQQSSKLHKSKEDDSEEKKSGANESKGDIHENENENIRVLEVKSEGENTDTPKMKYRCKLCGQPKQNHTCPYQQALQRSIGTMSFPALNAFQCKEPGKLAPSLSDMNNFVDLEGDDDDDDDDDDDPTPYYEDGEESSNHQDIQIDDDTPAGPVSEMRSSVKRHLDSPPDVQSSSALGATTEYTGKRRKLSRPKEGQEEYSGDDKLFHEPMEIKPEQYRLVSSLPTSEVGTFKYPTLPLTFKQRKSMSESLFELSQGITGLTDECAEVLQVARETDSWDLAVSELMTQILVVLHCPLEDDVLDGLRQHLMSLGFSC